MTVIDRIASFQFDPLEVAGRNHDLVLLARIDGYRREWTDGLLYEERSLFEAYNKGLSILPTAELPYHRITWDRARARHDGAAFDEHAPLVEELLERIRENGPLVPGDVGPRAAIDWYWRPTNQVRAILEALAEAGILGLARRDGNRRIYDLAERLFPEELLAERPSPRDQFRHKLLSRYRGHGLLGTSGSGELWLGTTPRGTYGLEGDLPFGAAGRRELLSELLEAGELLPVEVEGIRGSRFIVTGELPLLTEAEAEVAGGTDPGGADPGVAFLAPLDPLVWDRDFLRRCYDFDYVWEVYVPAAKRRWGYYVLPIIFGDRLVGRIEPRIDRRSDTLRIVGAGGRTGSTRWQTHGSFPPSQTRSTLSAASAASVGSRCHARRGYARSRPPSASDWPSRLVRLTGRVLHRGDLRVGLGVGCLVVRAWCDAHPHHVRRHTRPLHGQPVLRARSGRPPAVREQAVAEGPGTGVGQEAVLSLPAGAVGRVGRVEIQIAPERVERNPATGRLEPVHRLAAVQVLAEQVVVPAVRPVEADVEVRHRT